MYTAVNLYMSQKTTAKNTVPFSFFSKIVGILRPCALDLRIVRNLYRPLLPTCLLLDYTETSFLPSPQSYSELQHSMKSFGLCPTLWAS